MLGQRQQQLLPPVVLICDVGKSAVTPTIVRVCCVAASAPNVNRLPITSPFGASRSASGFEMTVTSSAPDAIVRRETAPAHERDPHGVQISVTDARHVRGDEPRRDVGVDLERDALHAVAEVERQAIRHGDGLHAAGLRERVAEPPDLEAGVLNA